MSDLIIVALVAATGPVAVAIFSRWQDAKGQERATRAEALRAEEAHRREMALRRYEQIAAVRARQAEAIRQWTRDYLMSGVNIVHYATAVQLAPTELLRVDLAEAARRLIERRGPSETASLSPVVAEISNIRIIEAFRALATAPERFHIPLQALVDFIASNPAEEWSAAQSAVFDGLVADVDAAQAAFDREAGRG